MTNKEKKSFIIRNWNISSGDRITDMLKRYFRDRVEKSASEAVIQAQGIIQ